MAHMYNPMFFFVQLLILVAESRAKVPAVIVFGDSSVDAGNNNRISTVLKSNFEPYGRDFTVAAPPGAGTGYDNQTSDVLSVIPLWKELEYYKEYQGETESLPWARKANEILSESLYLMSLGTNDFLENYYIFSGRSSQYTVPQYEDFLVGIAGNFIKEIYSLGARKVSLGGLPPMGCLPLERTTNFFGGSECIERYENAAGGVLCDGDVRDGYLCNRYNMLTCPDASKYVFWDSFHPTEKTNEVLIGAMFGPLLLIPSIGPRGGEGGMTEPRRLPYTNVILALLWKPVFIRVS
ncbi:GDSL esterase/lipase [Vitis vinifera]|uniref:GDSL esterase/lipase n=1 Tax=Vitis vinifera TaxID=29760 RepID=A0A438JHJ0_VITVI|nr:GDSL esterase/lipase [Vitis vinifera]